MSPEQTTEPRVLLALVHFDGEAFRRQETAFAILNLFVLAVLLLLHSVFSPLLGELSPILLIVLGAAFLLKMLELLALWSRLWPLSAPWANGAVWISISLNMAFAILLTSLTNRVDSPYFVLLALPVLQAAYHFRLAACIGVIAAADSIIFFWVWHFGTAHPPLFIGEYFEAGVISLLYALMGSMAWLLVNQLRKDQRRLAENLTELERTREKLVIEEKLAVAGRLSSAIAHEIRNPVAIINSSLTTAERPGLEEHGRKEMYSIARSEAARLEKLTGEFLSYARPAQPQRSPTALAEVLGYIVEIARVQASKRDIVISLEAESDLLANIDRDQIQRALLNLLLNAVDATPSAGHVVVRGHRSAGNPLEIQVENTGEAIAQEVLSRIFEPFFTTKPQGTGLGLAISRNIARAHGGDLAVLRNEPGCVCFAISLSDKQPTRE